MPTYRWQCNDCDKVVDVVKPIKKYNSPPEDCECGSDKWTKQIGQTTFILKGENWHKSDYNQFERRPDKK